jgi:beta-1,4-mannosyl-glycoprotein beta-1,4-N-acetylglucosaminyltransferase
LDLGATPGTGVVGANSVRVTLSWDVPSSTDEFQIVGYSVRIKRIDGEHFGIDEVVDYFVLVESTHTHTGKEKPLYFSENKHLFEKINDKIIHVIVDDFPYKYPNINILKDEQWKNEQFQRNCITRGLQRINVKDNDLIIISDLDEIPDPRTLNQIRNGIITVESNSFEMDMYYYNLEYKLPKPWHHARVAPYSYVKNISSYSKNFRFGPTKIIIKGGGWHLSYFMSPHLISNKLKHFAHQEFNHLEFTEPEIIRKRIEVGVDLFGRPQSRPQKIILSKNTNLPPLYQKYLSAFC